MKLRPGLRSCTAPCATRRSSSSRHRPTTVELGCGGAPLLDDGQAADAGAALDASLGDGPQLGKRYADDDLGLELLCTRAGAGALTVDGRPLLAEGRQAAALVGLTDAPPHEPAPAARHGRRRPRRRGRGAGRATTRLTAAELLAGAWAGADAGGGCVGPRLRGHQRPRLPDRPVRGRGRGRAVRAAQLPAQRRPAPRPAGAAGRRRSWSPRARPATALAARGHRVVDAADFVATARAGRRRGGRGARRRRGPGGPALHERHDGGAQGRGAAPPPPDVLRDRHRRVRRRRARRGRAGERAAVPRRRAGQPAQQPLPRPPHRLPRPVRRRRLGRGTVRGEGITNAMVVPTMLARICDVLDADGAGLPEPAGAVLRRRAHARHRARSGSWRCCPTSTSPTPTGSPRPARPSPCSAPTTTGPPATATRSPPRAWRRPGGCCPPSRSRCVASSASRCRRASPARSGCGASRCRASTPAARRRSTPTGWFPTRDRGWLDADGYLFIEGRSDDTIIRGGENIAPAEIEEVLLRHPDIAAVRGRRRPRRRVGPAHRRRRRAPPGRRRSTPTTCRTSPARSLRGSKTPDVVTFVDGAALHRDRQAAAPGRPGRSASPADRHRPPRVPPPGGSCYRRDPVVSSRAR